MRELYPHMVDGCKPTIGGLPLWVGEDSQEGKEAALLPYAVIGARLRAIRESYSDLTQRAWAEHNGFNPTQYNNWETGARRIPVDAAEKLCETYGVTLDFIYRGRRDGLSRTAQNTL